MLGLVAAWGGCGDPSSSDRPVGPQGVISSTTTDAGGAETRAGSGDDGTGSTTAAATSRPGASSGGADTGTTGEEVERFDVPAAVWLPGAAPERVEGGEVRALPGGLAGPPLWVSNNPERFTGAGWLMQHARTDAARGGETRAVDRFVAYAFHVNGSGAGRRFHWVMTNPGDASVEVSVRGSLRRNTEYPIGPGTGPSVQVAREGLVGGGNVESPALTIGPGTGEQIAAIDVPSNGVIDGWIEVAASDDVFLYSVITTAGSADDALNQTQGEPASGDIASEGANAFGRSAGIYEFSRWEGTVRMEVPDGPAHVALALNTVDKFQTDGVTLQDQTAGALMRLEDSSTRTYGNYGVRYALAFEVCADEDRVVRFFLASNFTAASDTPSFTWNGPVRFDGSIVEVFTTPTQPRDALGTIEVAGAECRAVDLEFLVPGLITAGQQLVVEVD